MPAPGRRNMVDVYVAASSNIEPEKYLPRALDAVAQTFGPLTISPAYRNKAVGFEGDDFVNLAVRFATDLPAAKVKQRLEEIEEQCGRPRAAPKWAARTMDLDLLMYGDAVSDDPALRLPRPDLVRRAYMLRPLADIAPDLEHPTLHQTMRELWQGFEQDHPMVSVTIPRSGHHRSPGSGR
ncbi:MAG: 2-amino-4-hydroxy-6-hydroxymethyldihydropteridine diphosphokinase [Steroidobacteraceae bacterium]